MESDVTNLSNFAHCNARRIGTSPRFSIEFYILILFTFHCNAQWSLLGKITKFPCHRLFVKLCIGCYLLFIMISFHICDTCHCLTSVMPPKVHIGSTSIPPGTWPDSQCTITFRRRGDANRNSMQNQKQSVHLVPIWFYWED